MSALRVENLGVTIEGTAILTDISVYAAPGEWLGVIGPNGAGKSTLLHAACGVVGFTGRVLLGGDPLETLDRRACASRVALVPQTPVVPPGMSVVDYVLLGRTPHRGALGAESHNDRAVVVEVLRQLDLVRFARRLLTTLSGGERQRVFLARALAQQSAVVLLDEPTAALDIGHQVDVLHLVDQLRRELGLTIVSTLHDLTLAGRYPDTLVMLAEGRVVAVGAPREVLTPELIERHYGTPVRVLEDVSGLVVVPSRRLAAR
ncbi:MAG: ATP-binding cassette domain-containing protein [Actinobacteria bacterium]|uniref:Unannotated protein n=1 Tax=freshwater metagenome TaxID=449393 RepID=A0A6J7RG01_9ZZZZ|nr:ATP-binding cassette domain-containing protein [Actinomycetota bacterium]